LTLNVILNTVKMAEDNGFEPEDQGMAKKGTKGGTAKAPQSKRMDRRAMERHSAMIGKFLAQQQFQSLDDANRAIQGALPLLNGGQLSFDAETPPDRAQEMMWGAFEEASQKRRITIARKALEVCPDCADAYVLLAEDEAKTIEQAIDFYRLGVAAGERALDEMLNDPETHFWSELKTRPYLRSMYGLATVLHEDGQLKEAIDLFQQLMRLNRNDNQGVRMHLLPALIWDNRFEEAEFLLRQLDDEEGPYISYSLALLRYKKWGDCPLAADALKEAIADYPLVFEILMGLRRMVDDFDSYAPGSAEEATMYVETAVQSWVEADGAVEWAADVMARAIRKMKPRKSVSVMPEFGSPSNNVLQLNKFKLR
jgi:tetratricopeptide (TPR) repeat protein